MRLALKRQARFHARAPREAVEIETHLWLPDDRLLNATVRNLSPWGLMMSCASPVTTGTCLGVELPGFGIARAVVRWGEDGELGCQFLHPIPAGAIASRRDGEFVSRAERLGR